jgi:hypothetical protein
MAFRFLQQLSAFFNGFPLSSTTFQIFSTAFVTSTISQNIQMMIILTHA